MNPLTRLLARCFRRFDNPWPDARPLPAHVQAVQINPRLLYLHMERAKKPPPPEQRTLV